MTRWRTLLLVARRDFVERIKSRAFQISTALTVVLVLAVIIAPRFFDAADDGWRVAVVGEDPGLVSLSMTALQGAVEPIEITALAAPSREQAIELLQSGAVDVAVVADEGVIVDEGTSRALATLAAAAMTSVRLTARAAQLGLTAQQVAQLLAIDEAPVLSLDGAAESDDNGAETLALFTTILLFVSIVTYGQWILIGVIEEKSNRVVEVVVGAVPPRLLLTGKVLGIGLLGLLQLIAIGIVAFVALRATGVASFPATTGVAVAATGFWFLLGFAF